MALVARLRASVTEAGTKTIVLSLIDSDGVDILPPLEMSLEIERGEGVTEVTAMLVANIASIKLPHFGAYAIHLNVDGHELGRIPFRLVQVQATA